MGGRNQQICQQGGRRWPDSGGDGDLLLREQGGAVTRRRPDSPARTTCRVAAWLEAAGIGSGGCGVKVHCAALDESLGIVGFARQPKKFCGRNQR